MKFTGIEGNQDGYSFGEMEDLATKINHWVDRNRDKKIIDVKVVSGLNCFSALISYKHVAYDYKKYPSLANEKGKEK